MEFRTGSPVNAEAIADLIASFQSELTDDPSGAGAEEFLASRVHAARGCPRTRRLRRRPVANHSSFHNRIPP
jgi:hypothetical protein